MLHISSGSEEVAGRKTYDSPKLIRWGTVADLTKVGQTNPGADMLPGQARGRESGSIFPPGLR